MAASRLRRRTTVAAAVAAVALTVGLTTGCDAVNKALDCVAAADGLRRASHGAPMTSSTAVAMASAGCSIRKRMSR